MKKIYIIILLIMISATSRMMAQNNMMGVQYSIGYMSATLIILSVK